MNTHPSLILGPTLALVALVVSVWFTLMRARLGHVARHPPSAADFANGESVARYFKPVERPAQNLANLFEMPMLYFALVPLLMVTGHVSAVQVALAWLFVVLRAAHSIIHIGPNKVRTRFRFYLAASVALCAMWLGFAFDALVGAL